MTIDAPAGQRAPKRTTARTMITAGTATARRRRGLCLYSLDDLPYTRTRTRHVARPGRVGPITIASVLRHMCAVYPDDWNGTYWRGKSRRVSGSISGLSETLEAVRQRSPSAGDAAQRRRGHLARWAVGDWPAPRRAVHRSTRRGSPSA